jgi:outer membrane protein
MKTAAIIILLSASTITFAQSSNYTSLEDAYHNALAHDPVFRKARADLESAKQSLPIARANYLPSLSLTGTIQKLNTTPNNKDTVKTQPEAIGITIDQDVFDIGSINLISEASYGTRAALEQYISDEQDLIARTSTAYFTVLRDTKALEVLKQNEAALKKQAEQTQNREKAGLSTETQVAETNAQYYQIKAKKIAAESTLKVDINNLHAITGTPRYTALGISENPILSTPPPNNIEKWVKTATQNNTGLKSQHYLTLQAKTHINTMRAAFLPNITAEANISKTNASNPDKTSLFDKSNYIQMTASFTPFAGGKNFANTRKATEDYLSAKAQEDATLIQTENTTRKAFLSIESDINKINADTKSIAAAKKSYDGISKAYGAGTVNIIDLLNAETARFTAQDNYYNDLFDYYIETINLKKAAGTLQEKDLIDISNQLNHPIKI